jgi:hypothetical protein
LSETPAYEERMKILRTTPGMGLVSSMEYLLELQDVKRFRRGTAVCGGRYAQAKIRFEEGVACLTSQHR